MVTDVDSQALLIALGFGVLCVLAGLAGGPLLYQAMGASAPAQQAALRLRLRFSHPLRWALFRDILG